MKVYRYVLLLVVMTTLLSTSIGFAETKKLTLDEGIQLAKENSTLIRSIENQAYDIDRQIKTNLQLANKLESALEGYYDFVNIYEQVQGGIPLPDGSTMKHPLKKYIGRSKERLEKDLKVLDEQYELCIKYGLTADANQLLDVMTFINAYMLIGDEPELTKVNKYETFKKNENLLRNSVALINTKYSQGLSAAERGTEAGVIKLYVGLSDLGQGIELKKQLYSVYQDGLVDMKASYDKGLVASATYENQVRTVELMAIEIEDMTCQYDNLMYQLKLMCELPMESRVELATIFGNEEETLLEASTYYEEAYNSNMDYNNLMAELTYNEKNFAVMNKYLEDFDKDIDSVTPIYYQEKEDMKETLAELRKKLHHNEEVIAANVEAAYNDIRVKKKLMDQNDVQVKIAEEQLNATIYAFKMGLKTQLELDQVKLNYENVKFTADTNVSAYNKAIENFKLLVDYGVTYEL